MLSVAEADLPHRSREEIFAHPRFPDARNALLNAKGLKST
jgi:hypothetical protein